MTAAVLLSGGVDSIALTYWRRPGIVFTVNYGQRAARAEIAAARQVASELDVRHEIIEVNCSALGSGDMAGGPQNALSPVPEWWPYRNQLLVTLTAMRGLALGVTSLMLGSVASDGSHADGAPPFYDALDVLVRLQEGGLRVEAPALAMTTVELVRVSDAPRELMAWSHSCHTGNLACGGCRGCIKHYEVMAELYGNAY